MLLRWTRTVGPTCTLLLTLPPSPFTPTHNTSTIFLILTERDATCIDTSGFYFIFAGFDNPTQLLHKHVGLQGIEEMKPMYAKPAPMILGTELALQLSFVRKCDLRRPNLCLNIPVMSCSAVTVSTRCINILGMFVSI